MPTSRSRAANNIERIADELTTLLDEDTALSKSDRSEYLAAVLTLYQRELEHSKERSWINREFDDEIAALTLRLEHIEQEQ